MTKKRIRQGTQVDSSERMIRKPGSALARTRCRASAWRITYARIVSTVAAEQRHDPDRAEGGVVLVRDARVRLVEICLDGLQEAARPADRESPPAGAERETAAPPTTRSGARNGSATRRAVGERPARARPPQRPERATGCDDQAGEREQVDEPTRQDGERPSARTTGRRRSQRCRGTRASRGPERRRFPRRAGVRCARR